MTQADQSVRPGGRSDADATRNFMRRYFETLQGPKTPERLRPLIADEALLGHIAEAEAAFPEYTIDVEELVVEGGKVVLYGWMQGTHRGEFHGVPASGREVNVPLFVMYDVSQDRIVGHRMVIDTLALMQQLGAIPGPS